MRALPVCFALVLVMTASGCGSDAPAPIADDTAGGAAGSDAQGGAGGGGSGGGAGSSNAQGGATFYGFKPGDTLPEDLSWPGYDADSDTVVTLHLGDFHDPDGSKGINALLITEGSPVCQPCIQEAMDLNARLKGSWATMGVKVLQLMVDDGSNGPATTTSITSWKKLVSASWPLGADPDFTFSKAGSNPFPLQIVVDPRTLVYVARLDGYQPQLPQVESLAMKNH